MSSNNGMREKEPSEATIEVMMNHALLSNFESEAWVLKPTTRAESEKGYDANLSAAYQKAAIQYKSINARTRAPSQRDDGRGVALTLRDEQHSVLKRYGSEVAFYAFSLHKSYLQVGRAFQEGPSDFLEKTVMVPVRGENDLSDISTVRFFEREEECTKCLEGGSRYEPLKWYSGAEWLEKFQQEEVGTTVGEGAVVGEDSETESQFSSIEEAGSGQTKVTRSVVYARRGAS